MDVGKAGLHRLWLIGAVSCALVFCGCATCPSRVGRTQRDAVAQVSIIDALLNGVYDGQMTCGALLEKGDFGIGTFDALDGEMVVLEGVVYRIGADGAVSRMDDRESTPFATVTWFDPDIIFELLDMSYAEVQAAVLDRLPSRNWLYAVRVDGRFGHMKTRSVPRQTKPYPPFVEVAKTQPVFEMDDVDLLTGRRGDRGA